MSVTSRMTQASVISQAQASLATSNLGSAITVLSADMNQIPESTQSAYPWDQTNFSQHDIENMMVSNGAIIHGRSQFCAKKKKVQLSRKVRDLAEEYPDAVEFSSGIHTQPDVDIVQLGNQEQYFKPYYVTYSGCEKSPGQLKKKGFEAIGLNRALLDRIGAVSPALGLMLERPAATVTQSAFVKCLDAQIKYEIEKCECPAPAHLTSWLFDVVRADNIGSEEPNLVIEEEPPEKLTGRFKIYQKGFMSLILHFESLRPILNDIKRTYESVLSMRAKQIREILVVKTFIGQYEKSLDNTREEIQRDGYEQLNELQQQCFLLMRHVDKQDAAIRTMTEMLVQIEKCMVEENQLRVTSEDARKGLIVEVNTLRRRYGIDPAAGEREPRRVSDADTSPEEADAEKQSEDDAILKSEDPVLLKTALDSTRMALAEAQHRITILEADYSDVVPAEEFTVAKEQMDALKERNAEIEPDYAKVSSQLQELLGQLFSLTSDVDAFRDAVGGLRRVVAPSRASNVGVGDQFAKLLEADSLTSKWQEKESIA